MDCTQNISDKCWGGPETERRALTRLPCEFGSRSLATPPPRQSCRHTGGVSGRGGDSHAGTWSLRGVEREEVGQKKHKPLPHLSQTGQQRLGGGPSVDAVVEELQNGGVGFLKQPLLAGGGGVTHVHEDAALAGVAVHAAVADGVIEAFVLGGTRRTEEGFRGRTPSSNSLGEH